MSAPVLFINPPRRHDGSRSLFNNATLTLASYLRRHGVEAFVYSASGPHWKHDVRGWLEKHEPSTVAISCKWWDTLYGALKLAEFVKSARPDVACVVGGQTATSFAREIVERTAFDAVIKGDGERPLLDYIQGKPRSNLCTAGGLDLPVRYVQSSSEPEDLRLLGDLTEIAEPLLLKNIGHSAPYIWTGKGCRCACLFCGGSALGQKRLFGRKGYLYRPIDHVLHDIETLAPWSENTFMLDFDPIADPAKAGYYKELFSQLPAKRYHLFFYSWSLPDPEFIELLDERFASVFLSLDAQCYSERLRRELAGKNQLKPFRPNSDFEATIAHIGQSQSMESGLYGIMGLAGEGPEDVRDAFEWTGSLIARYGRVLSEVSVTPLSTEPGALLDRDPAKYGMVVCRKTFEDYVAFTGHQFYTDRGIHHADFDPLLPHPYGVYAQEQHPGRVHHDYHQLLRSIEQNMNAVHQARSAENLRFFTDRVGLKLHSRSRFYNPWTLLSWGLRNALERGYGLLEVDATEAHILCPTEDVLRVAGIDSGAVARLEGIRRALQGGIQVRILSTSDSIWGFWEQFGAEIVRSPRPEISLTSAL